MHSLAEQLRKIPPAKTEEPRNSKPRCMHCNRYLVKCVCPPETPEQRAYREGK